LCLYSELVSNSLPKERFKDSSVTVAMSLRLPA
jgi:hypothetical protein